VQEAVYYTHFFVGRRRGLLPNRPWRAGRALEVEYTPTIGLELEHVLSAPASGSTGTAARMMGQTNVALRPAPVAWDLRVEFLIGGAYRYTMNETAIESTRSHPLFTFEGNYIVLNADHAQVAIGATYLRGDDPDEGLDDQRYWQIAVKFRVK